MYIGKGHTYQKEVVEAVTQGHKDGVLEQKPTLVNLQCDIDHPTQCMADMLHIIHEFGGVENLKGKKVAMTWAYSPGYRRGPASGGGLHPLRGLRDKRPGGDRPVVRRTGGGGRAGCGGAPGPCENGHAPNLQEANIRLA